MGVLELQKDRAANERTVQIATGLQRCNQITAQRSHFPDVDLFRSRHASAQGWVFWFCSISSDRTLVSRGAFVTGAG